MDACTAAGGSAAAQRADFLCSYVTFSAAVRVCAASSGVLVTGLAPSDAGHGYDRAASAAVLRLASAVAQRTR
jgi:hypothetical protein